MKSKIMVNFTNSALYSVSDYGGAEVDIDEKTLKEWQSACETFWEAQQKMQEAYFKATAK
jgi:hypothetical protein